MKKRFLLLLFAFCLLLLSLCTVVCGEGLRTEPAEGCTLLNLYWNGTADPATSDVWIWYDGKDGTGNLFVPCEYGLVCQVDIPAGVEEVGFIVRTGCSMPGGTSWGEASKDYANDRFAVITGPVTEVWLKTGEEAQYTSKDGGKTLEPIRLFKIAAMTAIDEITYTIAPAARLGSMDQFRVLDGETPVGILNVSSLNNNVITGRITLDQPLDLTRNYTLWIDGYGTQPVVPTSVFDSAEFREQYTYNGDDLGAVIHGDSTTFKVWAPTASSVILNLYEAGDSCDAYAAVDMQQDGYGVWSVSAACGHGTYYTYTVTTALGTWEVTDPYAHAAGVNGDRGMVVDMSLTDPEGFADDTFRSDIRTYEDASVWEVHVRDFSVGLPGSAYPGKYLAFTETGLTNSAGVPVGIDYLKSLGVSHIHLQPVFDYATVDESDPDSGYNWGYDPKNYNLPEGSYSTDPYHGEVRITEMKSMIQAIHNSGMGVVMDVVYNHTSGIESNLNHLVPYYYYRFNFSGTPSNGSGCGNETASERPMFRKFMVDSVLWWAQQYHIDGFRFDLMALHDKETMRQIEAALHGVNPACMIYGEGWTGGTSALNVKLQTTQANITSIVPSEGAAGGIAVFNDAIRDGLKGSVFDAKDKGYINGKADKANANKIIFGLGGGKKIPAVSWRADHSGVINYMSCHDNLTLYDKLTASRPEAGPEELAAMQQLGAAAVFLSRGTPFMLAGEEMMRTKLGDSNSYKSSDEVNRIDWEALVPGTAVMEMSDYYRFLIGLRREHSFPTSADVSCEILANKAIAVTWTDEAGVAAFAVLNPDQGTAECSLPEGTFSFLYGGEGTADSALTVRPLSWILVAR